jgi:uncharacterized membrane protein
LALTQLARKARPGETVLILGATGVTGKLAVQIAKLLGAGRVIVAGRNEQVLSVLHNLGADVTIRLDNQQEGLTEAFTREGCGTGFQVIIEVTVLRLIVFSQISFTANPVLLIILWAIGLSMIALAGLIYLPMRALMGIGIAIIALHNLLGDVSAERFGRAAWIWDILYQRGVIAFDGIKFRPAYPVLPWLGVMASGYCLGMVFDWNADRRRRFLVRLGLALAAAFIVVRAVKVYGDPLRWSHQASPVFTVLLFLNVTKYPPSLDFLLMTLGPAMVVMAWLETIHFHFSNPRAHLLLAHLIAIGMNFVRYGAKSFLLIAPPSMGSPSELFPVDYGFPLWAVYAVWVVVLLLLYPACLWFARLKQRRHDWWLTYL